MTKQQTTHHRPTHTRPSHTRPSRTRPTRTGIWALRAGFAPRLFAAGVVVAGAAAVLAPIAGGHAEADVGDISVTNVSKCDVDWLGADLPYVGVTIHNANLADPTPVDVLMYHDGLLYSMEYKVVTNDLTMGFNPLLVNDGRIDVRDPATSNLIFSTGDVKPCGGPVEAEIEPSGPAEASLPVSATAIHTCGPNGATVGATIANPTATDTTVGVSFQLPSSGSSSFGLDVPARSTIDKTTFVPYGSLVRVTVVEKGVTLLDTGERVSFSAAECNQPAPALGAHLSFGVTADCSAKLPTYILTATSSAAPNQSTALTIWRHVDGMPVSSQSIMLAGGDTTTSVVQALVGHTARFNVYDGFGRLVFDSGVLISVPSGECGAPAEPPMPPTPTTEPTTTEPATTEPATTEPAPADAPTDAPTDSPVTTTAPEAPTAPESTVVTESGDSLGGDVIAPQANSAAPTGSADDVPVASGQLPVTGVSWSRLPALAGALLSAGLLVARVARRGGWTR